MKRCVPLERAAEKICEENSTSPLIFQLPPEQGKGRFWIQYRILPLLCSLPRIVETEADTGEWGCIRVFSILPDEYAEPADVILYIHGAGWVFGNFHTHEKLVKRIRCKDEFRCGISGIQSFSRSGISCGSGTVLLCFEPSSPHWAKGRLFYKSIFPNCGGRQRGRKYCRLPGYSLQRKGEDLYCISSSCIIR